MPFEIDDERATDTRIRMPVVAGHDSRTNAEIHDALHDRRRRVVPTVKDAEAASTGTTG